MNLPLVLLLLAAAATINYYHSWMDSMTIAEPNQVLSDQILMWLFFLT